MLVPVTLQTLAGAPGNRPDRTVAPLRPPNHGPAPSVRHSIPPAHALCYFRRTFRARRTAAMAEEPAKRRSDTAELAARVEAVLRIRLDGRSSTTWFNMVPKTAGTSPAAS